MAKGKNKMSTGKKIWIWVGSIVVVLAIAVFSAGMYFFHVAEVRAPKSFINSDPMAKSNPAYAYRESFSKLKKQTWYQTTPGGLKLDAWYVPAANGSNKTAVIAHGFDGNKEKMAEYGEMFHRLGYNVLIPDDRAAGASEGTLIGYGWTDRKDYVRWINQVIQKNGQDENIVMFGVSMGGATTMMTAGERLPSNVKAFIEDCGYDNVYNETAYQAGELYNLPGFPLVNIVSAISKVRAGYSYFEASSVKQLHKNTRPMFFIHGSKDDFVPTKMVYKNYAATKGPKELWIVKGAKHAKSFETNPAVYQAKVAAFLAQYDK